MRSVDLRCNDFFEEGRASTQESAQGFDSINVIAIDVASAVEYLIWGTVQYSTDSMEIRGDLKPSNILLDQDMIAQSAILD